MPARLIGKKAATGGKVEVFLLKKINVNIWQCLVGGKSKQENLQIEFNGGLRAEILKNNNDGASASLGTGTWNVKFNKSAAEFMKTVKKIGQTPLPPYISSASSEQLRKKQYQTVYAADKKLGSVAAPTAGLHFTERLIKQLKKKGVQFEFITLRVGLGTFAPVKVDDITKHKMHAEWIEISKKTLHNIIKAKSEGRRIIAVGTTSVRTLESVFNKLKIACPRMGGNWKLKIRYKGNSKTKKVNYKLTDYKNWTKIYIYPGYKFKAVDALITNFHLPKSTLLMLVSAFACAERSRSAGSGKIKKVYREAIKQKYRFYSYGDAMLIN